jgi:hypothetical protein
MEKKNFLTKLLAVTGTILVWLPIFAPILISAIFLLQESVFRIDTLMPAELFPSFLLGSGLLLWAALRAHSHVRLVLWGLIIAILMLFGGQAIASITGLASGEIEPAGPAWFIVVASLAVYVLGILLVGIGGVRLLQDLFKKRLAVA